MNDAGILAYLEGEKLSLTDEQKAVIRQYDQLLEEWKDQAERLQKEADQAAMAQLVEEEMNRQGVKNQKLIWALLDKDRLSLAAENCRGWRSNWRSCVPTRRPPSSFGSGADSPDLSLWDGQAAIERTARARLWV